MRAGVQTLSLLAVPLNVHILQALEDGEQPLSNLSRAVGYPPPSTMRSYVRTLTELGVVERRQEPGFPGPVSFILTQSGAVLLEVLDVIQDWLNYAPSGPVSIGSTAAKSAIKAFADGWSTGIVRALAARPFTLTELHRLIPQVNYPTLERRLTAMRRVGQVEVDQNGNGRGTPYKVTQWLREAVPVLTSASRWEHDYVTDARPVGRLDAEAAFLLTVPLLEFPADLSGSCRLVIEMRNGSKIDYAGAVVSLEEGKPASCITRLSGDVDTWIAGSPGSWFRWIEGDDQAQLDFGTDKSLARTVAEILRKAFSSNTRLGQDPEPRPLPAGGS